MQSATLDGILSPMKYQTGAHTTHRLMFHLVWIPKYRKRLLKGPIAARLKELFEQCAEVHNWEIQELNIQVDHVHMLLQIAPKTSVSQAVQYLKGGSSRVIRAEFPELEEFLWGTSFWADGFFAESIGMMSEARIRAYIKNQ